MGVPALPRESWPPFPDDRKSKGVSLDRRHSCPVAIRSV